jgi:RNA polymerase sigma-70 factor (ECF subfamily)
MKPFEEKACVRRILNGEKDQFRFIIRQYERLVLHIVGRIITNRAEQEEVAQTVFVKVYEKLKTFRFQSQLSTWIGHIAYHTALNHVRDSKKWTQALSIDQNDSTGALQWTSSEKNPEQILLQDQQQQFLAEAIENLPMQYRQVITLFHLEQMSGKEIGTVMDLPENTVKSHLFRARRMLKEWLLIHYDFEETSP